MDEALVKHPQRDVDRGERREHEKRFAGERFLEDLGGALERARIVAGTPIRFMVSSIVVTAVPSECRGRD